MKFLVPVVSSALLAIAFSACGQSESSKPASEPTKATPAKPAETKQAAAPRPKADRGALLYKKCQTCHTLGEGEKHKVGPNLFGIMGVKAGQKEGFAYSKAMVASEIMWTDENLDAYIASPNKFMPGNRMTFVGIRKAEDRALLIDYLRKETAPQ